MLIIFIFDVRYICRIDPETGNSILNPYTPIAFS